MTPPLVGDYVELTFNGSDSPIRGRVTDVDKECEDIWQVEYMFTVDNGENSRHIQYAEGEEDSTVSRYSEFSGSHKLGGDAEWRRME